MLEEVGLPDRERLEERVHARGVLEATVVLLRIQPLIGERERMDHVRRLVR